MAKVVAYIDGERTIFNTENASSDGYLTMIETEDGKEFYLVENQEAAGEKAREYWEDMAQDDPEEFVFIVGSETLLQWGLGNYAGPGLTAVQSLEGWLDLHLDCPEEHFAQYDGVEREFKCKHPDWTMYTIAYRSN